MRKYMNHPDEFVESSLSGVLQAHRDFLQCDSFDPRAIWRRQTDPKKIAIITGGGYGHFPLFLGYVGEGLCDGVAVGNIFSTPGAATICHVTRHLERKSGVLYLVGNYTGDIINFEFAASQIRQEGIPVELVKICDDIATAPREDRASRRATSGLVFAYKIAGAAAARGMTLAQTASLLEQVNQNMASYGIATHSCQIPGTDAPIFELNGKEMELGIGIHGEPGVSRCPMMTSREIAHHVCQLLGQDLSLHSKEKVALLVNSLGATSQEELYILYRDMCEQFESQYGVSVVRNYIGEFVTCFEMSGVSFTILRLNKEFLSLLDDPAWSPFVSFRSLSPDR